MEKERSRFETAPVVKMVRNSTNYHVALELIYTVLLFPTFYSRREVTSAQLTQSESGEEVHVEYRMERTGPGSDKDIAFTSGEYLEAS